MTTECIIQDIKTVNEEAGQTLKSYEHVINVFLDEINKYKSIFDHLARLLSKINSSIGNLVCTSGQAQEIIFLSKVVIGKLRRLIAKAKKAKLYSGYKTSLHDLSAAVDDFEEHISDFKFRHDDAAQERLNELLGSFSLSV